MIAVDLSVFVQISETSAPPSAFHAFEAGLNLGVPMISIVSSHVRLSLTLMDSLSLHKNP